MWGALAFRRSTAALGRSDRTFQSSAQAVLHALALQYLGNTGHQLSAKAPRVTRGVGVLIGFRISACRNAIRSIYLREHIYGKRQFRPGGWVLPSSEAPQAGCLNVGSGRPSGLP
jgi:hypothetical protein